MPEFDITDPVMQQHITNAIKAAHRSNKAKKASKAEQDRYESQKRLLQDMVDEMKKMNGEEVATAATATAVTAPAISKELKKSKEKENAPYSNYAPDMDVSIGCVPCTRAHLATISAALKESADSGDQASYASAREEVVALLEYDLTPEKLAATPEGDREVLTQYADRLKALEKELAGPAPQTTVAVASLKEALRFAREDGLEHPEVQIRMERTEEEINALERVKLVPENLKKLSPEQRQAAKDALPELRKARQDLLNHTHSVDELEEVTARIAVIDQSLNPAPDNDTIKRMSAEATQLNKDFRRDVLKSFAQQKGVDTHGQEASN